MLHAGRTGSTVLADLLAQHPELHWDGELLLERRLNNYAGKLPLRRLLFGDPIRAVQWRMALATEPNFGFELMPHHLEPFARELPSFVNSLRQLGYRHAIVLERRNRLRIIVSYRVAMRREKWHRRDPQQQAELTRVQVPLEDTLGYGMSLLEYLEYYDRFYEDVEGNLGDMSTLRLTYEQHIAPDGPQQAYEECLRFLDLPDHPVSVRYKKVNPYRLGKQIRNLDEVEDLLRGTKYEWMLDE